MLWFSASRFNASGIPASCCTFNEAKQLRTATGELLLISSARLKMWRWNKVRKEVSRNSHTVSYISNSILSFTSQLLVKHPYLNQLVDWWAQVCRLPAQEMFAQWAAALLPWHAQSRWGESGWRPYRGGCQADDDYGLSEFLINQTSRTSETRKPLLIPPFSFLPFPSPSLTLLKL